MGDVLLRINGQRAVGHAEATQLLRTTRGDLRLEISRSQLPIAATTLQRYWRGLGARRAAVARRGAAAPSAAAAAVDASNTWLGVAGQAAAEQVANRRAEQEWREARTREAQARRAQPCRCPLSSPPPPPPPCPRL